MSYQGSMSFIRILSRVIMIYEYGLHRTSPKWAWCLAWSGLFLSTKHKDQLFYSTKNDQMEFKSVKVVCTCTFVKQGTSYISAEGRVQTAGFKSLSHCQKQFLVELKFREIHIINIRCAVRVTPPLSLLSLITLHLSFPQTQLLLSFNCPSNSYVLISSHTGFDFRFLTPSF